MTPKEKRRAAKAAHAARFSKQPKSPKQAERPKRRDDDCDLLDIAVGAYVVGMMGGE